MKTQILGVNFDNISPEDAVERFLGLLDEPVPSVVVTPNPEMVMASRKDADFRKILNTSALVVPDGIGIVMASKLTQSKIMARVPGIDLVMGVMETPKGRAARWVFLGGAPGVADDAKDAMELKFPGLRVVDAHHGYFHGDFEDELIERLRAAKPDIVLVGLGFPRQEKWIEQNKHKIGARVYMGVGGSFDVMSGSLRRAPAIFRKFGLEWLYRLISQPSRIWRQRVLVKFAFVVMYKKIRGEI
ncbi:MAG: WecB/TagA/CpsF family glycosyltransferase [Defluviitaleaceae bacterium]|nr:WecB/TagA/CpsF family glycosyltransferase [Defluviitaleaceae bacterium]